MMGRVRRAGDMLAYPTLGFFTGLVVQYVVYLVSTRLSCSIL